MKCIYCGGKTTVCTSIESKKRVLRARWCKTCSKEFVSVESVVQDIEEKKAIIREIDRARYIKYGNKYKRKEDKVK